MLPFSMLASFEKTNIEKADSCINEADYKKAIVFYKKALYALDKRSIDERCEIYIRLGYIYKVLENFDDAFLIFEKVHLFEKKIKSYDLWVRTKIGYAELLRSISECEKSKGVLDDLNLELRKDQIKQLTLATFYDRYAAVLNQCFGDLDNALVYSEKALNLSREAKSSFHSATSLNEIGYILEHTTSAKQAIPYYKEALNSWSHKKHSIYSANASLNLSRCYNKMGLLDSALYYAEKGLLIVGENKWHRMLVSLYSEKISCLEQTSKWKEAFAVSWLYHDAVINMRSQEWSKKVASVKGDLELERKELEIINERNKFEHAENVIESERKTRKLLIFIIIVGVILILIALIFSIKHKRLNSKLKNTLSENDVLLKEVHHRVKNNMQVVSSLLDLQSSFAIDEKSKAALINSRDRINSLALAHQNLYIEDDLKSINIKNYLAVLIQSVVSDDVITNVEIDEGNLEIEKAQALGFVLNELLTNSIKHAWKNGAEEKLIWIKLIKEENNWSFYYSDNGVGVQDKVKFLESPTFGVTLIRSFLKRNLKVSISFGEKPGMNISFTFK